MSQKKNMMKNTIASNKYCKIEFTETTVQHIKAKQYVKNIYTYISSESQNN